MEEAKEKHKAGLRQGFLKLLQTIFIVIFILLFAAFVMIIVLGPSEASALAKVWSGKVVHAIGPLGTKLSLFFRKHPRLPRSPLARLRRLPS